MITLTSAVDGTSILSTVSESLGGNTDIYAVGYIEAINGLNGKGYITKINEEGGTVWERKFSGGVSTSFIDITIMGNFLYVVGWAEVSGVIYNILAKYNKNGNLIWQKAADYGSAVDGSWLYIDNDATNLYVAGYVENTGVYIGVVAKFNDSGTLSWSKQLQLADDTPSGIAIDDSGNVYVSSILNNLYKFDSTGALLADLYVYDTVSDGSFASFSGDALSWDGTSILM
jgi:6-phosphogluconolactonase (cycloisomerase 2 family)